MQSPAVVADDIGHYPVCLGKSVIVLCIAICLVSTEATTAVQCLLS
jgi:hypothetical protein